jgi:hypothetical protein
MVRRTPPMADILGKTFGRLTVIEQVPSIPGKPGRRVACQCRCGASSIHRVTQLIAGITRSCGCIKREQNRQPRKEVVNYMSAHLRLYKALGSASTYPCVDCGGAAAHWSYDNEDPDELVDPRGRRYSVAVGHYHPRCERCHGAYDAQHGTLARICRNGHERRKDNTTLDTYGRTLCLDCQEGRRERQRERRRSTQVCRWDSDKCQHGANIDDRETEFNQLTRRFVCGRTERSA